MGQLRINQVGLPPGTPGRSRTDGLATGALVTLENVDPSGITTFRLLWGSPDDTTARSSLAPAGADAWTFSPTPDCYGTYIIELLEDGLPVERRIFGIRTPSKRLLIPALNEQASKFASWINDGPDQVALSQDNAIDYDNDALNALAYAGWWRSQHELYRAVETGAGGYRETFAAAATWIVNHNFGRHPYSWAVETLGGVEIDVAVQHVTANQSVVSFDTPTAGIARFT